MITIQKNLGEPCLEIEQKVKFEVSLVRHCYWAKESQHNLRDFQVSMQVEVIVRPLQDAGLLRRPLHLRPHRHLHPLLHVREDSTRIVLNKAV